MQRLFGPRFRNSLLVHSEHPLFCHVLATAIIHMDKIYITSPLPLQQNDQKFALLIVHIYVQPKRHRASKLYVTGTQAQLREAGVPRKGQCSLLTMRQISAL